MSIAYLDPGNIEADLQEGIVGGQSLNWVLFWATVVGLLLQVLAARLGAVTGTHLAEICQQQYPPKQRYLLWAMMEIAIVGSDIQEVIGTAIALNILSYGYIPLYAGVLICAIDTFFFFCIERAGVTKLESFFALLISIMAISFFSIFSMSGPPAVDILEGIVVPRLNPKTVLPAVGIIGAVIMPHNVYLHSALVSTIRPLHARGRASDEQVMDANRYLASESAVALFVSFLINLAVVSAFAQAFYKADLTSPYAPYEVNANATCQVSLIYGPSDIRNESMPCVDIGLGEADGALESTFGPASRYIWAIGILAAGQSSTMTGTYAGQFVMEGFTGIRWSKWKRTAVTRAVAIVPAVLVALSVGKSEQGSTTLSYLNQWLNVVQSIQLPFALVPVLKFTNSELVMGSFKNGKYLSRITWTLALLILAINVYLVFSTEALNTEAMRTPGGWVAKIFFVCLYLSFVSYIVIKPVLPFTPPPVDMDAQMDISIDDMLAIPSHDGAKTQDSHAEGLMK
jgi:natural resistance-associated macrophage protein